MHAMRSVVSLLVLVIVVIDVLGATPTRERGEGEDDVTVRDACSRCGWRLAQAFNQRSLWSVAILSEVCRSDEMKCSKGCEDHADVGYFLLVCRMKREFMAFTTCEHLHKVNTADLCAETADSTNFCSQLTSTYGCMQTEVHKHCTLEARTLVDAMVELYKTSYPHCFSTPDISFTGT